MIRKILKGIHSASKEFDETERKITLKREEHKKSFESSKNEYELFSKRNLKKINHSK